MNILDQEVTQLSELIAALPPLSTSSATETQAYNLRDIWSADAWKALVGKTVDLIQQGAYAKVVLAREVEVTAKAQQQPFHLATTLQRLRQNYPAANIFAFQRGERAFVGATPERLAHAQDGQLHTMALAGSAPRGANADEDRRLGSSLLHSQKNREEHGFVTAMLRDSLAHLCSKTWIADTPELLRLKNIQHLQTAIVGELLPGRSILDALQTLHPTPAVGGTPTEPALAFIRERENLDRGWYAGPIGWIDLQGNGEFAVALRSALLERRSATLFAGCGIVKDSDPEAEYAESCLKLQVILRSLSGEE
jgi:isochorismate synthase